MALSEFEVRKIEIVMGRFLEKKRPPPHLRNKVDIAYTISNQSVEIFEKREHWLDPSKSLNTPIAKATFVKRTKRWKLYCVKAGAIIPHRSGRFVWSRRTKSTADKGP